MINKEYWDNFYKLNIAPTEPSNFAQFVLNYIKNNNLQTNHLIDIACGNGRDTFFFSKNNIQATGIDLSVVPKASNPVFLKRNILDFDYSDFDLLYLRFIVHALKENELDVLLEQLSKNNKNQIIFIETRSSKGITDREKSETFFKSTVGEQHFRMLYSEKYLTEKLKKHFDIIFVNEGNGFSVYKEEDPTCIRYILRKK